MQNNTYLKKLIIEITKNIFDYDFIKNHSIKGEKLCQQHMDN